MSPTRFSKGTPPTPARWPRAILESFTVFRASPRSDLRSKQSEIRERTQKENLHALREEQKDFWGTRLRTV